MLHFAVALATILILSTGCGGSSEAACGPIVREALDPSSLTHVLPGAPKPKYLTSPPTSGAHQPTPGLTGVQRHPIEPQVQVGLLEQGQVLLQYHGLTTAQVRSLRALASDTVVVAPAKSLPDGDEVIATAWVTKQSCRDLDVATLRTFISTRVGRGPGRP